MSLASSAPTGHTQMSPDSPQEAAARPHLCAPPFGAAPSESLWMAAVFSDESSGAVWRSEDVGVGGAVSPLVMAFAAKGEGLCFIPACWHVSRRDRYARKPTKV